MRRYSLHTILLLLGPALFLAAFFLVPLFNAVAVSFELPNFNLEHYRRIIDVPLYRAVYLKTLRVALLTTAIGLVLAYPCAYYVSRLSRKARLTAITLVAIPFMLSVLVRNYVWILMLQDAGLVNRLLQAAGATKSIGFDSHVQRV